MLEQSPVKSKPVSIKKEIGRYLRLWPWMLLSMLVFFAAAKIYLRYAQPQFLSKSVLQLKQIKNDNSTLADMKNLGMGISDDEEMQAETTVILSRPILSAVAQNLNLGVAFFGVGSVKEVELYKDSPLTGKILHITNPRFYSAAYTIKSSENGYYTLTDAVGKGFSGRFGTPLALPFGTAVINFKSYPPKSPLKVVFSSDASTIAMLESTITASIPENKGRLMELSTLGPIPQKSEDILNELMRQYNADGLKDKDQEAENTANFIDRRLDIISHDLAGIENKKEDFKRQNHITDLVAQANLALQNGNDNTKALLAGTAQLNLINAIDAETAGEGLLPTDLGLPAGLDAQIAQYDNLLLTRNRTLKQATNANPAVIEMNKQIGALKNLIKKSLAESRETLNLQLAQANAQINSAKSDVERFPGREKISRSIDRQQNLKEQLYLYLLQKREENAITLAANADKAKIVNPAYTAGQIKPNKTNITAGALATGFLLPLLFFFGKNMMETRVKSRHSITAEIPGAAVVAEIPAAAAQKTVAVNGDFSIFAEAFRILASNIKFLLKADEKKGGKVVLVTSTIKGEGKTTVSINTAITLAGKNKVLILGADIRNPRFQHYMAAQNKGLTDFLISDEESPGAYIFPSALAPNLDVLFSGTMAPNPADLLEMKKFSTLLGNLCTVYDYIIIDSAPVMLVSDTLHLVRHADALLYVVRSEFTEREMLGFADEFIRQHAACTCGFVLNGVKPENTRYGTRYGYRYHSEGAARKKWHQKIFG